MSTGIYVELSEKDAKQAVQDYLDRLEDDEALTFLKRAIKDYSTRVNPELFSLWAYVGKLKNKQDKDKGWE